MERRLVKRVKQRQTYWLNRAPESEMPATKSKGLEDLFHDTLKDIYYAERKNF